MKKKRRNVLVYTDDTVKWYTQLTIQVDDAGNEWLAPGQIDFLESAHNWARYEGSSQLTVSANLFTDWLSPVPKVGDVRSSGLSSGFASSTPAFNDVLV